MNVETLIKQLGTALPMMGAKDLVNCGTALQFQIGRNPKKVSKIRITLATDDTYTVRAYRKERGFYVDGAECDGVYADGLHAALESLTGLYTRL